VGARLRLVVRVVAGVGGTVAFGMGALGLTNFAASYKYAIPAVVFGAALIWSAFKGRRPFFL